MTDDRIREWVTKLRLSMDGEDHNASLDYAADLLIEFLVDFKRCADALERIANHQGGKT